MNLTDKNEKEKKILRDIALKLSNSVENVNLLKVDNKIDSYYKHICCNNKCYIQEYSFDSPMELKSELFKLWQSNDNDCKTEFIPVVLASAFKNRKKDNSRVDNLLLSTNVETDFEVLPTYIYTF